MEYAYESRKKEYQLLSYRTKIILVIMGVLFFGLILLLSKAFALVIALFVAHIIILRVKKMINFKWILLELTLFSTVVAGIAISWKLAPFVGLVFILTEYFVRRSHIRFAIITIPIYMIVGLLTVLFKPEQIVMGGIILSIIYAVLIFPISMLIGASKVRMTTFCITNLAWNILLFTKIAPLIIS